jgi:hypothetical protein
MSNMRTVRLALNEAEQAVAKARRAIAEMLGESGTAEGAPAKTPTRREKAARAKASKVKEGASTATKTATASKKTATAGKSSPKTSNGAHWTVEEMMPLIEELRTAGVFSEENGIIFSLRGTRAKTFGVSNCSLILEPIWSAWTKSVAACHPQK